MNQWLLSLFVGKNGAHIGCGRTIRTKSYPSRLIRALALNVWWFIFDFYFSYRQSLCHWVTNLCYSALLITRWWWQIYRALWIKINRAASNHKICLSYPVINKNILVWHCLSWVEIILKFWHFCQQLIVFEE